MASFQKQTYGNNRLCILNYDTVGEQEVINVPYVQSGLTVQLSPVGGTASLAVSNDGINWITSPEGNVSASTIILVVPVRYLRVTNNATTCGLAAWGF